MYWECQEGIFSEDGALFPRVFPSKKTLLGLASPDISKSMQRLKVESSNLGTADGSIEGPKNPCLTLLNLLLGRCLAEASGKIFSKGFDAS